MRIQLQFQEAKAQELRKLMEKVQIRKYHEFFNNALTLTKWAIEQAENGRTILSLDERTGRERELAMPFLSTIAEGAAAPEKHALSAGTTGG